MQTLRRLLYLAVGAVAWHDVALGQSAEDQRAAEETEFPGLRLVATRHVDSRLNLLGIRLAYVEQDVRLGTTGKYFCGGLSLDRAVAGADPVGRIAGATGLRQKTASGSFDTMAVPPLFRA